MKTVGIIGAGASGMMAAITAADFGAEVTLLEKNDRIGKKILATGNGKCNFSNQWLSCNDYFCKAPDQLERLFQAFNQYDTISFFEDHGMLTKEKNGYLYPYSEQASTVLDILRKLIAERKIEVVTDAFVHEAYWNAKKKQFQVKTNQQLFSFDRLILSCGSLAGLKKEESFEGYRLAEGFGHHIEDVIPALVQLKCAEPLLKGMAGVRCQAEITLRSSNSILATEQGELQLTDYGISGIPVFQLSRIAGYALLKKQTLFAEINFFPEKSREDFTAFWEKRVTAMQQASLEAFVLGLTNKKISQAFLKKEALKPDQLLKHVPKEKLKALMQDYCAFRVQIVDHNGTGNAQVCAGGVDFRELTDTLESVKQKGLYLTGELLDVDGRCGGYNLQFAWTSGYIAGREAAREYIC